MKKVKSEKKKLSLFLRIVIGILAIIIGVCIAAIFLIGNDTEKSNHDPQQTMSSIETQSAVQQLLDNEFVKVSFNRIYEVDGVEGVFYLDLDMENKTDKEIWLYLDAVSINGEMTIAMSGVPTVIAPEKKSSNPFFFSFSNLSISQLNEVKEISFKVVVENHETGEKITTSEEVTISQ